MPSTVDTPRYEVQPVEDGWVWRLTGSDEGDQHNERATAIAAARAHRGDTRTALYTSDGTLHSENVERGGNEALVLLRADGSVYGELDHAISPPGSDGSPQRVSLPSADTTGEAV